MFESFLKQRGQISILFALLMPIFLLIVGVGLDLGWYYLNVSRLQNAADAAAVAGAQTLINNENFSDYKSVTLTSKYPGKVSEQYRTAETAKIEAISESRDAAKEYVAKNLSSNEDNIINSWTHEKVEAETPTLYEKDDNLYFVVQLREEIRHFFLPGWFGEMDAPVTAVAMITKSAISDPSEPSTPETTSTPTAPTKPDAPAAPTITTNPQDPVEEDPKEITPELTEKIETAKNKNVIVGNWEVQRYYRKINEKKIKQTYIEVFGSEICVNGWNIFQDENVYYTNGNLYRTEHVKIFDDVELNNYKLTGKERYTDSNVKKLSGATGDSAYALKGSSVKKTANNASTNTLDEESYTYNAHGYPYVWEDLDSIDVDFKPEVSFNETSPYLSKDWDLPMGYDAPKLMHSIGFGHPSVGVGTIDYYNITNKKTEKAGWYNHLRIHSTITFGEPYKERTSSPPREDMNLPDILWARIESEPMFRYPDSIDHYVKTNLDIKGLNSVRQIILNFTVSNYDTATQKYRPVVIFYDGPEMYYPYSTSEDSRNKIRTSRPIIVNLNVPYRLILYAPNSPVVVMGTATDGFQGFIVAKKYLRLKTTKDFIEEDEAYFNKHGEHKYTMAPDEKSFFQTNYSVDNPYYGTEHTTVDKDGNVTATITRDNGEPKKISWLYTKIINPDNGIEMYVDDYGNVQYMELENPPTKIGKYETFGRTDFSSHGYHILGDSAINLIVSGN